MWICITHTSANPIIACAIAGGMRRRLDAGSASKKPRKKTSAPHRMYDVLIRWPENWIVHGIVSGAGGELKIDSAPGAGTKVTIRLPASRLG